MQNSNVNNDLANRLTGNNGAIDVNIYRKKDPQQQYRGWGYALNNLMRNPNLLNGGLFGNGLNPITQSFLPQNSEHSTIGTGYNQNLFGNIGQVGLPFVADLIWGNKYE